MPLVQVASVVLRQWKRQVVARFLLYVPACRLGHGVPHGMATADDVGSNPDPMPPSSATLLPTHAEEIFQQRG